MKRLGLALALWASLSLAAVAQVGGLSFPGPGLPVASGAPYTGPIDINGTAFALWSTRCGSTSYTGNVVDIWDGATGSTTETLVTCSSGGILNTSSPTALATTCAIGCKVKTLYDQSGATQCSGACDLTQATNANRPVLNPSLLSSKMGLVFAAASSLCLATANTPAAHVAAFFTSGVYNFTGSAASEILSNAAGNLQMGSHDTAANQFLIYNGGGASIDATANDNTTHAAQALFNNTSSSAYIDGTLTNPANAIGTIGIPASNLLMGGKGSATCASGNNFFSGNIFEVGVWGTDKSANNATMNSNQHTYWGF